MTYATSHETDEGKVFTVTGGDWDQVVRGIDPLHDEKIIVNMGVWTSIEALRAFTYSGAHLEVFKQRRDWFSHMKEAAMVMWWVPAGHIPTIAEARDRLAHLRAHGPTPFAFPFGAPFPPPAETSAEAAL